MSHRVKAWVAAAVLLPVLTFAGEAALGDGLSFTDITEHAGVGGPGGDAAGGHGAMWADATGNDLPDLYMPFNWKEREYPDYFYRNLGGGRFAEEAARRGIDDRDGGSHGGCWADLNNNGHYDLVNGATLPYGEVSNSNTIYRNDGRGFFADVTPPDMARAREYTRAVLAFDMNGNGLLDIFCVTGYLGSDAPPDERNELYRNDGDLRFTRITDSPLHAAPAGQGAIATDYNGNGRADILAANRTGPVNIFRNDGGGAFTRVDPADIGIDHRAGDGIVTADVNNSGHLDLLLCSDDEAHLYMSSGDGTFRHAQSFSNTRGYMGGLADLNNDGHLDLVFAGGAHVYLNDGTGGFARGPELPNYADMSDPRGIAFADIDGNGRLDFVVGNKGEPNKLYRNNYSGPNNYLKVKLIAPTGQAGAIGARTRIHPAGRGTEGPLLGLRESRANHGYLAQDDPVLHFGLAGRSSVDVVVTFPDGTTIRRANVAANQTITIDARPEAEQAADAPSG